MKDKILQPVADTWVYNYANNTWIELNTTTSPSPRHTAAMTYDPIRSRAVLYGGNVGYHSDHNADTWVFDSRTLEWMEQSPDQAPTPLRGDFDMVYSPTADGYILFGGNNKTDYFGDTWFLDSSFKTWSLIDTKGPKGRGSDQSLVAAGEEIYLYGGFDKTQGFDDIWSLELEVVSTSTTETLTDTSPVYSTSVTYTSDPSTENQSTTQETLFSPILIPLIILVFRKRVRHI